jgi:hypothetical protein
MKWYHTYKIFSMTNPEDAPVVYSPVNVLTSDYVICYRRYVRQFRQYNNVDALSYSFQYLGLMLVTRCWMLDARCSITDRSKRSTLSK